MSKLSEKELEFLRFASDIYNKAQAYQSFLESCGVDDHAVTSQGWFMRSPNKEKWEAIEDQLIQKTLIEERDFGKQGKGVRITTDGQQLLLKTMSSSAQGTQS